ncbi:hypothetical protein [Pseudomonas amygdali]|nr:hypothetical protein [Pseudomonas amygdali]
MSKEFKLVPARILLDKNVIGAINFHCGDGDSQFGDYVDGELWVGALTDDDGKEVYGLHLLTSEYPEEGSTTLAEFAAPQPPALGGEPEVLAWVHPHRGLDWRVERMRVAPKTELIDRAHLAPLQADLKSAIADKEAYGQNAIDLRKK